MNFQNLNLQRNEDIFIVNIEFDVWTIINNILAVIGLLSLITTVIRIIWTFSGGSEWIANVEIKEYPLDLELEGIGGRYPQYYPCYPDEIRTAMQYATQNMFIPENTIIRKLVLKKLDEKSIAKKKLKYRKVYTFKMVTPQNPVCIVIERGDAIAPYLLEWKTEYGGKTKYYFYEELRNGNNNRSGFEYEYGFFAKIRKILDLR